MSGANDPESEEGTSVLGTRGHGTSRRSSAIHYHQLQELQCLLSATDLLESATTSGDVIGSRGRSELRILFAFDPVRHGVMLLAGDKSGNWKKWYRDNIPVAEDLFDYHIKRLKGGR